MLPEKYQWTAGFKRPEGVSPIAERVDMLTVRTKKAGGCWSAPQVWRSDYKKTLPEGGPPTWVDKCLRSYSPSNIRRLFYAIKVAHFLRGHGTDGEVIVRGRGFRSMYAGWDACLEALGVNDYMRVRGIISKWPRIERFLLERHYI